MMHTHNKHDDMAAAGSFALKINLVIAIVIMIAEVIGGLLSNSLALLSDAGHMLVDCLAIGISLFALNIARRPATSTRTFGFHRAEILAALANGTTLILLSAFIIYEAYRRLLSPPDINTPLMLIIAAVGLIANLVGITLLRRIGHMTLNIRAAFWHIAGDTISSLGVITAAIIMMITGWTLADPIIAIVIGLIILWGAIQLVRESTDILLEAAPKQIPVEKVTTALKQIPGINEIHDVHIWTITSGIYAMSAHLVVKDLMVSKSSEIIENAHHTLADQFNITHSTFQLECETCPTNNVCGLNHKEQ